MLAKVQISEQNTKQKVTFFTQGGSALYYYGLLGFIGVVGFYGLSGLAGRFSSRILPINPISPIIPMPFVCNLPVGAILLLPVFPRLIHFLLDAAFFQKVALLPLYEPTDKDVALMDKCDGNIGDGLVRTLLNLFAEDGRVKNAFNVR